MNEFLGVLGTDLPDSMRGLVDAPYHILGRSAFCGEEAACDGRAAAMMCGRLRNPCALVKALKGAGAALSAPSGVSGRSR